MMNAVIPGVILAAGASARMGCPKALLPLASGETFLTHIVRILRRGGVEDVVVVGGCDAGQIAEALGGETDPPRLAINPDWRTGQLSSLVAGLRLIDHPGVDAMLMTLIDVPLVSTQTVRVLIETYRRTRAPIVRPAHGGLHGHPVIFDRAMFDALRHADRTVGAKSVVRAFGSQIVDVDVDDEGAFADIDTPEDYERLIGRPVPSWE
jgi:molybdenum cofactor cytidylyltransferase